MPVKQTVILLTLKPHASETDSYLVNIEAVVHRDQQEDLIFEQNDFIHIPELDYTERKIIFS